MNLNIKLGKNFTTAFNKMCDKYGEDFELLNGFHETQMNYTDFIDNFTKDNIADVTIDPNANVGNKDVVSLNSEKSKSHDKLFCFNKIFYELQKKYGIKTAREWLEAEWSGAFYLNNSSTSTLKPYCYKGEELLTIMYEGEILNLSFKDLYNLIDKKYEKYDVSIKQFAKFPNNLYVQDITSDGNVIWTKISRIVQHSNSREMRFIKYANGLSQIVTDDHPIITENGEIPAKDVSIDDKVFSIKPNYFSEKIKKVKTYLTEGQIYNKFYTGLGEFNLTNELGWIIGMFLSEGTITNGTVSLTQNPSPQLNKLISICEKYNIPYSVKEHEKGKATQAFTIKRCPFSQWIMTTFKGQICNTKKLPSNYIHYSDEFMDGIVAGMIDGDGTIDGYKHRHCQIRITSEQLCHQLSNYLSKKNIFCGDRTPFKYNRAGSFEQKLPMFGIGFTLTNEEYFLNIGSIKINDLYEPRFRKKGNFAPKKYQYNYGWINIIENTKYIDNCPIVYDITTETGHFICNNILSHNCFSYSLERLAKEGLFFLDNYNNQPPQHLDSFNQMVVEYVSYVSARSSGAVGLGDYLYWSFYFWYKDKMAGRYWEKKNGEFIDSSDKEMRQEFQRIIYRLNQPFLRVDQSAFTNMSIYDRIYLEELFGGLEFPNADSFDKGPYVIDYIEDLIAYEKAFMEEIKEIKRVETFTFPVLSYNLIYKDNKFADEEFAKWACRQNMEYCEANFLFSEDPATTSQCCRILNNPKNLKGFMSSIGGAALNIGSVQVNNINLARIAYEANGDERKFFEILKERTILCQKVLDVIRHIIKRNVEKGLLKNYQDGMLDMEKQFSTIGIVACYEAVEIFNYIKTDEFGNKFYTDEGLIFANKILDSLNQWKDEFECDYSWNLENTPAENCARVLARKDELLFNVERKRPVYSNQWIPLMEQTTIQEKLRLGAVLDKKCGGGQISHITIDKPFTNFEVAWKILNEVAKSGVIYFAFNCAISKCANKHIFHGEICPECGQKAVDTFTRVVGFITRVSAWSKERQEEGKSRFIFDLNNLIE